jgi:DNA-binding FrmR family transcriptional regulator
MTSLAQLDPATQRALVERLKRIEGQARGIARMIEDGRDCVEVVQQLAAMRAAVDSLSAELVQVMVEECWQRDAAANSKVLSQVIKTLVRAGR